MSILTPDTKAARTPEVIDALNQLSHAVTLLTERSLELGTRLAPVLSPSVSKPAGSECPKIGYSSPMASGIAGITDSVQALADAIDNTIRCLEI